MMAHLKTTHAVPFATIEQQLTRCFGGIAQKDLTSSWTPYLPSLPSYFNSFLPRPSPILEIAIDSERNILYTRSQNSSIQVPALPSLLLYVYPSPSQSIFYCSAVVHRVSALESYHVSERSLFIAGL